MAEAIGLIASVVQVAGAGLKLSQTLYQYADGVATADRRIKDIAKEIELTSGVIDELGDIFKQDETASLISKNAVKTANETMNECSVVFAEIEATLAKSKKGRMGRLMLPFRDSKIDLLRSHIDKLKDTLQLLMQVLTHAHLVSSKKLDREAEAKQREEIKQLLENKKQSTKRYEESLKNFSISDGSTAVDDDQESDKLEEDASNSTAALTVAASALASTISPETLAKCVDHVRNLLQNIETLQQALATKVDGDDHSDHHQRAVGSYFRARSHLDNILLGNSKAGTPNSGGPVPSSFEHVQNGIQVAMPMRAQERSEASDHAGFAKKKARAEDRERARAKAETREKVAKLAETLVRKEMMKGEQRPKEEHEMRVAQAKPQVELEELRKRAEIEHGEFKEHEREARRREIEMGSGPPRPTATRRLTRSSPVHDPSAPAYLIPLPDVAAGSSPPHSHTLEDGRKTSADNAVAADDLHVHKERDIWEGSETYTKRDITAGALAEVGAGQIIKHHCKRKGESAGGNVGYALRYGALDAVGYIRRDGEVYDDDEVYEEYQGYNGEGKGKLPAPVSDEFSDHPTGIGSSLPSQPSEAPITEDDRVNQQMALLLAKTDSPTSPNTNAWASTFGIDLPRDREQHLDKHMRSQELVGTPVAYKAAELPELPDEKRQQEALWRQAQDTKAFEREARRPARREAPRRQARREAHPWSLVRHGSAGSQESQAAPSAIDSPTTHGTGTYPIQQRRPSESRSRSSTRKVSKPEIIIQIGSMKGKSRASHFRHTSSVSCSSKAYKRSSLGQSAPSDTVPELQRPPVEPPVTIAEADSPPTYPKIPDDIHYRPGSLSPYLRTSVDASKPSAARIRLPPPISFPPGITFPPKLPAVFQDSRIGSYRTTVVAPTSVERHSDAYSPTPPDLPILDLDAEASTGDEDTVADNEKKQQQKMSLVDFLGDQSLGTWTDEIEDLRTTEHIPNPPRPVSPSVYQSISQDATELSSYGAHMDTPRSRYDLQHTVPMIDLQDDEAWYTSTSRSTTPTAGTAPKPLPESPGPEKTPDKEGLFQKAPQSKRSADINLNPYPEYHQQYFPPPAAPIKWVSIISGAPSPTPADIKAKENETDEVGGLLMSQSTTPTTSNNNNQWSNFMEHPPYSVVEPCAENEVSMNGPSEVDFFTRRASISPSTRPVLNPQESAGKGVGDEGDEVDELLREWTTMLG